MKFAQNFFLIFAFFVLAFVSSKVITYPGPDRFEVRAYTYSKPLEEIKFTKDYQAKTSFYIPNINFPLNDRLIHSNLGLAPLNNNYLLKIVANFEVEKDSEYTLMLSSDDGFKLKLDKVLSMQSEKVLREYEETSRKVFLRAGKHNFELLYYQQAGQAGLQFLFKNEANNCEAIWGENKCGIIFKDHS